MKLDLRAEYKYLRDHMRMDAVKRLAEAARRPGQQLEYAYRKKHLLETERRMRFLEELLGINRPELLASKDDPAGPSGAPSGSDS